MNEIDQLSTAEGLEELKEWITSSFLKLCEAEKPFQTSIHQFCRLDVGINTAAERCYFILEVERGLATSLWSAVERADMTSVARSFYKFVILGGG